MRRWRRNQSDRNRPAFTIVEVLVAMTVMAIGMVAVFEALRMANEGSRQARDEFVACLLAEQHMVSLMAKASSELAAAHGIEGRFAWEEQVRRTAVANMAEVTVIVQWRLGGRPREFRLVSLRELRQ